MLNMKNINRSLISSILKGYRKELGLTQKQIADKMGLKNAVYICQIEKAATGIPINRIVDLVDAYKLDHIYLLIIAKLLMPDTWHFMLEIDMRFQFFSLNQRMVDRIGRQLKADMQRFNLSGFKQFLEE